MSIAVAAPNGHTNGTADVDTDMDAKHDGPKFASGLILPPPEIKSVIDRTALFVARSANPPQFEDKIRENQRQDPKFSFLNPADPYHAYYRHRMKQIADGEVDGDAPPGVEGAKDAGAAAPDAAPKKTHGREPPVPDFMLDIPHISAMDLDTIKLTALFTARRGRSFLASLSVREGRNYQFDFLRPNHSLFGYFNRLVEQYGRVLQPEKEVTDKLAELSTSEGKWAILEETKEYAEWERFKFEKEKKRQDATEAERVAFAEIDWHDYVIVQTIEFTAADATSDLPFPMSIAEIESMTLTQKRMAAMIMETTAEDVEALRARQAAAQAEAAAAVGGVGVGNADPDEVEMEVESDEEDDETRGRKKREAEERERELERAKAIQATSLDASGPMKIRTDYVPKLGAKSKVAMTTCTVCGQQVPVDELQEHMRIELLDPRWKSQRDVLEARKAQASELQKGANVSSSLRQLARTRVDIFGGEADEDARKKEEEEELLRRKEREKNVWDGHTASKASMLDKFQSNVNFDEQIAAIHRRAHGPGDMSMIGPGIGPASVPPPMLTSLPPAPSSLPANPTLAAVGPAVVSSGPQPPNMFGQPPPVMLPPLHYPAFGQPPPLLGMHPARLAALGPGGPMAAPLAGTVRSAEEMLADIPPAKRQKIARLPEGQYYPEGDWVNLHPAPISLMIQLPAHPEKPEWKLDGSLVTVPDLPVTLLLSTLRDRIITHLGSTVPASRLRLAFGQKLLTNANSLASYNLEDEDVLMLGVRDPKKK